MECTIYIRLPFLTNLFGHLLCRTNHWETDLSCSAWLKPQSTDSLTCFSWTSNGKNVCDPNRIEPQNLMNDFLLHLFQKVCFPQPGRNISSQEMNFHRLKGFRPVFTAQGLFDKWLSVCTTPADGQCELVRTWVGIPTGTEKVGMCLNSTTCLTFGWLKCPISNY